jgi:fructokinase
VSEAPRIRIGIDVGGTKIEGIALDGTGERARIRIATPRDDYRATVDAIVTLIGDLERCVGVTATVGIGIPGTISPASGVVKNANSVWLIGRPLQRDVEDALGRAVRVANDANCFAISEATDGAAAGVEIVFGVILGTGVGAGIVAHGRVLSGANGIAGEWGHNALPWPAKGERPGPACYCGRSGCIETYLSGPGMTADYQRHTGQLEPPERIVAAAAAGDLPSDATLVRYERRLARALASIINVVDPDVIVVGGGMSNIDRLYTNVPSLWTELVFNRGGEQEPIRTRLVRAAHGDSSGVRGAAWLWTSRETDRP